MLAADYARFLEIATGLQWQESSIDLAVDAASWKRAQPQRRDRLLRLLAGFAVGERAVAHELEPFALAADDRSRARCFRVQAEDEARHARFFDRVADEVCCVAGETPGARLQALRPIAGTKLCDLFERRLPELALRLLHQEDRLAEAVGLYHMLLEGVVFSAGQYELLESVDPSEFPGLHRGVELVVRDERWHLGFGVRVLHDIGVREGVLEDLLGEAGDVCGVWGDAISPGMRERIVALHRRRLRAAGMIAQSAAESISGPPRTPFATFTS